MLRRKVSRVIPVSLKALIRFMIDVLKGRYQKLRDVNDKKVIIIGNGPSLNEFDFNQIQREDFVVCCVNFFPIKNSLFRRIKPEYICLIDPAFFRHTIKAEEEKKKQLIKELETVDWPMTVIVPVGEKLDISNEMICYKWLNRYAVTKNIGSRLKYFLYDHNIANYGFQNVILGALYYFIVCGFKKIFLVGIDLSDFKYLYVDENNRVYVDSTHSYGTTRYYFDEMPACSVSKFYEVLGCYQKMFVDFNEAKKYKDFKGVDVYNLSLSSYIDSFPKIDPKDLIKE